MPLLRNAKKALRVSERKAIVNRRVKSRAKTMTAAAVKEPTMDTVRAAFSAIDRAVKGKIFHKNKAARLKSQLSKKLSA